MNLETLRTAVCRCAPPSIPTASLASTDAEIAVGHCIPFDAGELHGLLAEKRQGCAGCQAAGGCRRPGTGQPMTLPPNISGIGPPSALPVNQPTRLSRGDVQNGHLA